MKINSASACILMMYFPGNLLRHPKIALNNHARSKNNSEPIALKSMAYHISSQSIRLLQSIMSEISVCAAGELLYGSFHDS